MPLYQYVAVRSDGGRRVKGTIVAENDRAAREKLRESRLVPVSLEARPDRSRRGPTAAWQASFARQLGTLLKAGFPLARALPVLAASSADVSMKSALLQVDENVRKGLPLSEAVTRAISEGGGDASSTRELTAMMEAGEASGSLAEVLLRYAELLERRLAFRRRLRGALFYPLMVAGIAMLVILFLFVYVLPTITKLFEGTRMTLPMPTRVLFGIVAVVKTGFWPAVVLVFLVLLLGRKYFRSEGFRLAVEDRLLAIPFLGAVLEKAAIARWARSFGSLLENGVGILQAMDLAARASQSARLRRAVGIARPRVAEGIPLARSLAETGAFPPLAVEAITVGESSGALPELLGEMAMAWETEVEASAERFADLLEPLVLVVMGFVVGAIVLAVLLPIFELNASVG